MKLKGAFLSVFLLFSQGVGLRPGRRAQQHNPHQLQHTSADGAGEGVPLQQVPDAGAARRDRRHAGAQRDSGEDLVPEQAHEAEEARARGRLRLDAHVLLLVIVWL